MVKAALLNWISNCPLGILICILGILGNGISICVWRGIIRKRLDSGAATSMYFISLAVIDSFVLIFFILVETIPASNSAVMHSYSYLFFYCYFGYPLFYFFVLVSIWLLVAMTISRCIIVSNPLKGRIICNSFRTFCSIIIITVGFCGINVPRFFIYYPKPINDTYFLAKTEFGHSRGAHMYKFWVHCMLLVLVPWASLCFMNAGIVRSMKKRVKTATDVFSSTQQRITDSKREQDKVTWMLLTVSFTFLALLAGQCVSHCLWMMKFGYGKPNWNTVEGMYAINNLGIPINSAINWVLYCVAGSSFRRELVALFRSFFVSRYTKVIPVKEIRGFSQTSTLSAQRSPSND